jgi:hypothetical protein
LTFKYRDFTLPEGQKQPSPGQSQDEVLAPPWVIDTEESSGLKGRQNYFAPLGLGVLFVLRPRASLRFALGWVISALAEVSVMRSKPLDLYVL